MACVHQGGGLHEDVALFVLADIVVYGDINTACVCIINHLQNRAGHTHSYTVNSAGGNILEHTAHRHTEGEGGAHLGGGQGDGAPDVSITNASR